MTCPRPVLGLCLGRGTPAEVAPDATLLPHRRSGPVRALCLPPDARPDNTARLKMAEKAAETFRAFLPFGRVWATGADIERLLSEDAPALEAALERVAGRRELVATLRCDPPRADRATCARPATGRAWLGAAAARRRRSEEATRRTRARLVHLAARAGLRRADLVFSDIKRGGLAEGVDLSVLVPAPEATEVRDRLRAAAVATAEPRLAEVTGPWPCFTFGRQLLDPLPKAGLGEVVR